VTALKLALHSSVILGSQNTLQSINWSPSGLRLLSLLLSKIFSGYWVHRLNHRVNILWDKLFGTFQEIVGETSNYDKLNNMNTKVEGNSVILTFEYSTGDASGQNMVTICTDNIIEYVKENFEITPKECYIESNYSGDKKATAMSFSGDKVASEVVLNRSVIEKTLRSTPEKMAEYWVSSTLAVI